MDEDPVEDAKDALNSGQFTSCLAAARHYSVDHTTLGRRKIACLLVEMRMHIDKNSPLKRNSSCYHRFKLKISLARFRLATKFAQWLIQCTSTKLLLHRHSVLARTGCISSKNVTLS
jgi:hypothetical protein